MANPRLYLPPVFSDDELRKITLPPDLKAKTFRLLNDHFGEYHRLYQVTFDPTELSQYIPPAARDTSLQDSLILRIAGKHFTTIKSINEIDTLSFLSLKTAIPVPSVLWYSETSSNPLGYEYMFLTHAKGQAFDVIYSQLETAGDQTQLNMQTDAVMSQLAEVLIELLKTKWTFTGGLRHKLAGTADTDAEDFIGGPLINEQFWHEPELDQFWDGRVTYSDLNPGGPFSSWTELERAKIEKYIWIIERHDSLAQVRHHLPRIIDFRDAIRKHAAEINDTTYILAHRDLHMGNVIYDVESGRITAVIDWEFAAVVPIPRSDAMMGNLLYDCGTNGITTSTRELQRRLKQICRERGTDVEAESRYKNQRQKDMTDAVNYLRAVTEVLPRGEVEKNWEGWIKEMLIAMDTVCRDDLVESSSEAVEGG